ncbi:phospholipase D-like domain-containing protein [Salinarimonas rosea]|uniref:phospholipase D-like domain-containing protein n=1 Tax=Salinarimonas rosea TaxID=552063 RepID=UPI000429E285|nr:phospholipase D-like domain-containing protein [Salinarimonas rosea]
MDAPATILPAPGPLLRAGDTAWRTPRARRAAVVLDNARYFALAKRALLRAERQVLLLGWAFDPRTRLDPRGAAPGEPDAIGEVLNAAIARNPALDVRLHIWDMVLPISLTRDLFPQRAPFWLDPRIRLELADDLPIGACHHQKLLVVDDALAFVSGDDFSPDRWDTRAHRGVNRLRAASTGEGHAPHHGVTLMLDGEAAARLGDLARRRWAEATGRAVPAPPPPARDPWPEEVAPDFVDVRIGIARAAPHYHGRPGVREGERLTLESIRAARRLIYLENQYFAAPRVGEALARRLAEPDGPEVVAILSPHSPSWFDRMVMDSARDALVAHLNANDPFDRFRAFAPHARDGRPTIVHAKTMVVDDRLLRIGSANLNNRSLGFDTELDVAIEAAPGAAGASTRAAIAGAVDRFVGHFIGCEADAVAAMRHARGGHERGLVRTIEALDGGRRLRRLRPTGAGPVGTLTAAHHLGDPPSAAGSWKPWRRRAGPARLSAGHWLAIGALGGLAGWGVARGLARLRASEDAGLRHPDEQR